MVVAAPAAIGRVERLFPGEPVVCVASGPSLMAEDVAYCQGRARVIAVKDAIRLAPWADVLYGAGADCGSWWKVNGPKLGWFTGPRYTLDPDAAEWATVLRNSGETGLDADPSALRTGKNSGYQSIGIAAHLGAAKIVLLGFDMSAGPKGRQRWFGSHPWGTMDWSQLGKMCAPFFDSLVQPLADRGIAIVNASRSSALKCFPRMTIEEALS